MATWKTENLYLQNNYNLGRGSASHISSWRGAGNKSLPWPHLTGNLSERLLHCHVRAFPQGPFCAEGEGRQVSSNSASSPRSFIHMLGTTVCSSSPSLAGAWLSLSLMACGIVYALPLPFILPNKASTGELLVPFSLCASAPCPVVASLVFRRTTPCKSLHLFSRAQVTVRTNGCQEWSWGCPQCGMIFPGK